MDTHTIDRDSFQIVEFCRRNGISRSTFYNLQAEGRAPRTFNVGRRVLISKEAAAEWRERMEKLSA